LDHDIKAHQLAYEIMSIVELFADPSIVRGRENILLLFGPLTLQVDISVWGLLCSRQPKLHLELSGHSQPVQQGLTCAKCFSISLKYAFVFFFWNIVTRTV